MEIHLIDPCRHGRYNPHLVSPEEREEIHQNICYPQVRRVRMEDTGSEIGWCEEHQAGDAWGGSDICYFHALMLRDTGEPTKEPCRIVSKVLLDPIKDTPE